jgi:hypothetical protein
MSSSNATTALDETRWWRPDSVYSALLLVAAIVALAVTAKDTGLLAGE